MKFITLITLVLVTITMSVQARLGETFEQCKERYKEQQFKKLAEDVYTAQISEKYEVELTFARGKCVIVCYTPLKDEDELTVTAGTQMVKVNTGHALELFDKTEEQEELEGTAYQHKGYLLLLVEKSLIITTQVYVDQMEAEETAAERKAIEGL